MENKLMVALVIVVFALFFTQLVSKIPKILDFARGISLIVGIISVLGNWEETGPIVIGILNNITSKIPGFILWVYYYASGSAKVILEGLRQITR